MHRSVAEFGKRIRMLMSVEKLAYGLECNEAVSGTHMISCAKPIEMFP